MHPLGSGTNRPASRRNENVFACGCGTDHRHRRQSAPLPTGITSKIRGPGFPSLDYHQPQYLYPTVLTVISRLTESTQTVNHQIVREY